MALSGALALTGLLTLPGCSENAPPAQTSATGDTEQDGVAPPLTIAEKYGPPGSVYGSYLAGLHARAQNDSGAAAVFMGRVLTSDSKNQGVLQAAFVLNLQNGDFAEALPLARQLHKTQPDDPLSGIALAAEGFKSGDYAAAKQAIAVADGQGLGVLFKPLLMAWAEMGLGNKDAALASLTPLSENASFQPFFSYHSGLILALAKQNDLAEEHFTALLADAESRSLRGGLAFGQFLETQKKNTQAADVYRSFASPLQPHPLLGAAIARNDAKQMPALPITDAAQGAAEVLYGIGSILSQDSRSGAMAIVYVQMANYLAPDFYEARMLLAGILESTERYDQAIEIFATMPATSPLYETAQIQIAINEERAGREEAAARKLQKFVTDNPGASLALLTLADMLRNQERFAEAIPFYDRLLASKGKIEVHHWPLLYARGICHERAGNWEMAERDLQEALALQPDQPHVLNYLAYSWIDKGMNLHRAREMVESAAKQRPDDGAIIDSLGWMHYRAGEFQNAVEALENAVSLMPQDAVINDHLGDAYWRVGRKLEAQFQWQRALTLDPEPDIKKTLEQKLQSGLQEPPADPAAAAARAQKS